MKYKWLNKAGNNNLIVFFNGWGMDEEIVKHLHPSGFDVIMFYDYNTISTDFDFLTLKDYNDKYLISWSMGVMVATKFSQIGYKKKIAINGTLKPIDINFGINPKIYDLTIKCFNEESCNKFISNMFISGDFNCSIKTSRTLENVHQELIALKDYVSDFNFEYDKILISDNDKIIPTKNQVAFWKSEPTINCGHCVFFEFEKWSELL